MAPETLNYLTLDVFTQTPLLGNPLAVVLVPSYLSPLLTQERKQLIAREFNYSETTFLHLPSPSSHRSAPSKSDGPDSDSDAHVPEWRLDIFLTDAEVPLAGHPIIGTAVHALTNVSGTRRGRFVTRAGKVELSIDETGYVTAVIPHEEHLHRSDVLPAAEVARLQPALASVMGGTWGAIDTLSIVRGMTFVFVEVPDVKALGAVELFSPRLDSARLDEGWNRGQLMFMFYVKMGQEAGVVTLRTRMVEGMFEDPATGSASCGLAVLLSMKEGLDREGLRKFEMVQAVEMGRRSDIGVDVDVKGGKIESVALRGTAVEIMKGSLRYE
ncbi:NAP1-binding protein 2 [Sphaceloma murrayae]|uniref:NAP1-binding protein 2 n=1 Tax=Sphaceloma murrayae TaxID=2082308 RepID=A0A2K1QH87_9PEZI|nr:NAP1-binding protein 2 [Sphaceloma murrayae]